MQPLCLKYQSEIGELQDKEYRDSYLDAQICSGVAYQVQALRKKSGLSQKQFGISVGKPQSVVSRLEDTEYGSVTVQTLLDVAKGRDVALVVKFVSYPDFLEVYQDVSEAGLTVENIDETLIRVEAAEKSGDISQSSVYGTILDLPTTLGTLILAPYPWRVGTETFVRGAIVSPFILNVSLDR